ncbi:hypothetical protein QTP70_002873 [Hemibagrus guttatus]|uniref:Reverse transcriptase n=1 Tax=Hemibagrus guttatus TaxID=175788 RepID=A0AAE0QSS7_9TELE|nr:hypothetical protein QTP70_002873 [Hemibagrus guttatus]
MARETRAPALSTSAETRALKRACVRRRRTGLAAGAMAFKTLTRRPGFKVLATAACSVEECTAAACSVEECTAAACSVEECTTAACSVEECTAAACSVEECTAAACSVEECTAAVAKLIGAKSIVTAARMNKSVVMFVDDVSKAETVVLNGVVIKGTLVKVFPLSTARRVVLSNVPPFIDDEDLCKLLSRQWWDHGKVLIQQLCREYTVNITRDITKSLKDLEIGIVELQVLAESTGDRRHVEDLKVKKALMADLLGTKAQGALIRSRFKGANEMDSPSKHFFGLEKKNGQSRLIHTLHTGNGQYITHTDEIRWYATDFYQDLYRSEHRDSKELLDTFYQGLPKVSSEDNAALEGPLVLEELQVALNTMPGGKAPGIDGLPVEFYKFFWKELGEDLLEVLEESCRERCLPLSSRRAVITLLPKKGDLQDIKNWRPVSLLCTDYKVMSKALANRLKDIMDSVGCELGEKERFWSELDEVMESIPTGERVVIGADFNGHVGEGNTGDEEVMGKF